MLLVGVVDTYGKSSLHPYRLVSALQGYIGMAITVKGLQKKVERGAEN